MLMLIDEQNKKGAVKVITATDAGARLGQVDMAQDAGLRCLLRALDRLPVT